MLLVIDVVMMHLSVQEKIVSALYTNLNQP